MFPIFPSNGVLPSVCHTQSLLCFSYSQYKCMHVDDGRSACHAFAIFLLQSLPGFYGQLSCSCYATIVQLQLTQSVS